MHFTSSLVMPRTNGGVSEGKRNCQVEWSITSGNKMCHRNKLGLVKGSEHIGSSNSITFYYMPISYDKLR